MYLNWKEKLKFWWKFLFRVEPIREVDAPNATVGMYLYTQGLNVVGSCFGQYVRFMQRHSSVRIADHGKRTISTTGEVRKVELDLVPALIKSHGHCADEGLDSRGRLQNKSLNCKALAQYDNSLPATSE